MINWHYAQHVANRNDANAMLLSKALPLLRLAPTYSPKLKKCYISLLPQLLEL